MLSRSTAARVSSRLSHFVRALQINATASSSARMAAAAAAPAAASSDALPTSAVYAPHRAARSANPAYPARQEVDDAHVSWNVAFESYSPPEFTTANAERKSADPSDARSIAEKLTKRHSYEGALVLDEKTGRPLNPLGRTGLAGRGRLYNWGPNHAADPVVTRAGAGDPSTLEIVVIQRGDSDSGLWAFPGGMVDPGEKPDATLKREFAEEAMEVSDAAQKDAAKAVHDKVFANPGVLLYQGYVDDPRNTDNSWMESYFVQHHLDAATAHALTPFLHAGDDATNVRWLSAEPDSKEFQQIYPAHQPIWREIMKRWKSKMEARRLLRV